MALPAIIQAAGGRRVLTDFTPFLPQAPVCRDPRISPVRARMEGPTPGSGADPGGSDPDTPPIYDRTGKGRMRSRGERLPSPSYPERGTSVSEFEKTVGFRVIGGVVPRRGTVISHLPRYRDRRPRFPGAITDRHPSPFPPAATTHRGSRRGCRRPPPPPSPASRG